MAENLKTDKPIVAIETVPVDSPFYNDLCSRQHRLGENKRRLAIKLYKELGIQVDWSSYLVRKGMQTCWFTSEVDGWNSKENKRDFYRTYKFHRPLREYLKKDCKLSLQADDGEWAVYINGDL